jgi:hypothetical protein
MPDYEGSVDIDPDETGSRGDIDPTVETHDWKAVPPPSVETLPALYFIDGVQRTEARVLAWRDDALIHGMFGTVAAGAVTSNDDRAVFDNCGVRRVLMLGGSHNRSVTMQAGNAHVTFEGIASSATAPAELARELRELMRQLEAKIAESVVRNNRVIFIDGPLAYISSPGTVVGLIKRISLPYLDPSKFALATFLSLGERTPLFLISDGKRDRYSWYLRIGIGRSFDHVLAGVIRLEIGAAIGLEGARHLAGMSAVVLPRFASLAVRDARAPQNLVPVGALEEELRSRSASGSPFLQASSFSWTMSFRYVGHYQTARQWPSMEWLIVLLPATKAHVWKPTYSCQNRESYRSATQ